MSGWIDVIVEVGVISRTKGTATTFNVGVVEDNGFTLNKTGGVKGVIEGDAVVVISNRNDDLVTVNKVKDAVIEGQ